MEEAGGVLPHSSVASSGLDFSTWLQRRNAALLQQTLVKAAVYHAPKLFRRLLLVALLLAVIAGAVTSAKALGNAGTQLNIFWVLGVLLGLSWLSLLLWLLTLLINSDQAGVVAPLFNKLLERLMPARPQPTPAQAASHTWLNHTFAGPSGRWRLGWVTHLLWTAYLLGGLVSLLLLFTTRQFDFVWESTLLDGASFVESTRLLASPLIYLGLPVPDAQQILASQIDTDGPDASLVRRSWALFLLGCLMLYGAVPRLVIAAICWLAELRVRARQRADFNHPYYVNLQREFWPRASTSRILDADTQSPSPSAAKTAIPAQLPKNVIWLGLELPQQFALPPAAKAQAGMINIQDAVSLARAQALLSRSATPAALLVDGNKAADRGLQRLVMQLTSAAGANKLWLVLQPQPQLAKYQSWLQTAARAGLTPEQVVVL